MTIFMISSTILIALVLLLRVLFRGKASATAIYAMWAVVVVRLLVPVQVLPAPGEIGERIGQFRYGVSQYIYEQKKKDSAVVEVKDPETEDTYLLDTWTEQVVAKKEDDTYIIDVEEIDLTSQELMATEDVTSSEENETLVVSPATIFKFISGAISVLMLLIVLISNLHLNYKLKKNRRILRDAEKPCIYETDCVPVPCLYGLFAPAIYLTKDATQREEVEYIIAHENMHYRHLDFVWSALRVVLVCVYWFHPLVWVAAKVSRQDAEYAADEAVIQNMNDDERVLYGKTILNTLRQGGKRNLFSAASQACSTKKELKKRMVRIGKIGKKSLVAMVLLGAMVLGGTACAFGGKQTAESGQGKKENSSESELGEGATRIMNQKTTFDTNLDEAITEVVKDQFAFQMSLSSSGAYVGVKNEKITEAHEILAKEEDEDTVTVYVMRVVSCYGTGAQYDPKKHYGERGGDVGICGITFKKTATGYEKQELWDPYLTSDEKDGYMKAVHKRLSQHVPEVDLDEWRYMPWLRTECHQEALEHLQTSEVAGTKKDAKEFVKIEKTVEKIDIFSPEITLMEVDSKNFIQKLVDAYNHMELVPVSNLSENKMDVKQAITINFHLKGEGKILQVIFDGGRRCWINGEPHTLMMDTQVFDYNEILAYAEKNSYLGNRIEDPFGMGAVSLMDYDNDVKIMEELLSEDRTLTEEYIRQRAKKQCEYRGTSLYEEMEYEKANFMILKKRYLVAKELGLALRKVEAQQYANQLKERHESMGVDVLAFCEKRGITKDQYMQYCAKWCQLTQFDYETYKGIRNITDQQVPDTLEQDMAKVEVMIK